MKRTFLLLLTAAFFGLGNSSAQEFAPGKKLLENASTPNQLYETKLKRKWINDNWVIASKTDITYNSKGFIVEEIISNSEDGQIFHPTEKITYGRNSQGKILSVKNHTFQNDNYEMVSFSSFEYNNDKLSRKTMYASANNSWDMILDYEFYYTAKGEIKNIYITELENGMMKNKTNKSFTYSVENIVRQEIKVYVGGQWKEKNYIDYEYDSNDQLTKSVQYTIQNTHWIPELSNAYTFNNNLLTNFTSEKISPTQRTILETWDLNYDINGYVVKITKQAQGKSMAQLENSEQIEMVAKLPSSIDPVLAEANALNSFPNPANNFLTIGADNHTGEIDWRLMNLNGQIVKSGVLANHVQSSQINTAELAPGMYFLNWNNALGQSQTNNIIIAH